MKNGMEIQKFNPTLLNNLDYQSTIISDNMKVLLENIQFFKIKHLSKPEVSSSLI